MDGIRSILSYVDLPSLVRLFATLDRNIHKLLFTPGAFAYLNIEPIGSIPRVLYRNFLGSLRNVNRLVIQNNVLWSASSLSLLTTLNPRSLSIGTALVHPSVYNLLIDLQHTPMDRTLRHMARFLLPDGSPNFKALVPQLETLVIRDLGFLVGPLTPEAEQSVLALDNYHTFFITFPSTLTSVSLLLPPIPFPWVAVELLPAGLRSLTLDHGSLIADYPEEAAIFNLTRFTQLEYFSIKGGSFIINKLEIPRNLQTLSVECTCVPWSFLVQPALKSSKITHMTLAMHTGDENEDFEGLDLSTDLHLARLLPSSLIALTLKVGADVKIVSVPPSLIEFELFVDALELDPVTLDLVSGLQQLKEFCIEVCRGFPTPDQTVEWIALPAIVNGTLPKSLESLTLAGTLCDALTKEQIRKLPTSLTLFNTPAWPLSTIEDFHDHLPNCMLRITEPLWYWQPEVGGYLMEKFQIFVAPVMDVNLYFEHIQFYYSTRNALFFLQFHTQGDEIIPLPANETTHVIFRHAPPPSGYLGMEPLAHFFYDQYCAHMFPCLELLDVDIRTSEKLGRSAFTSMLPDTLTAADFKDSYCEVSTLVLPRNLTSLSGGAHTHQHSDSSTNFPAILDKLKFLSTPNLEFTIEMISSWKNLDSLKATVVALPDYNIVPFLTTFVGRKTRLNMKVSIKYYATGALIPDNDDMTDVTWEAICRKTEEILASELAKPMPPLASKVYYPPIEGDTIGRVVSSLTRIKDLPLLCLPASTERARISEPTGGCILIPRPSTLPQLADGLYQHDFPITTAFGLSGDFPALPHIVRPSWSKGLSIFPRTNIMTRLDLTGVTIHTHWMETLPHSLTYLRLARKNILSQITGPFPPKLTTLILEEPYRDRLMPNFLWFSLGALPRTLRHLVILTVPFELHNLESELKLKLDLPALKTVQLSYISDAGMITLTRMLPMKQLTKFEYQNVIFNMERSSMRMQSQHDPYPLLNVKPTATTDIVCGLSKVKQVKTIDISDLYKQYDALDTEESEFGSPSSVAPSLGAVALSPSGSIAKEPSQATTTDGAPASPSQASATSMRKKAVRMPRK